jgi:hypothetical protein
MKLDPGMHIGMHLVFFGKAGVTKMDLNRDLWLFLPYAYGVSYLSLYDNCGLV